MKKKIKLMVIFLLIIAALIYKIPISINKSYEGYLYENEITDVNTNHNATVHIEGKVYRKIFTENLFQGTINVEGEVFQVISWDSRGSLLYRFMSIYDKLFRVSYDLIAFKVNNTGEVTDFGGLLYVSRNFESIWISGIKKGSSEVYFASPASNQEEVQALKEKLSKQIR